MECIGVQFTHVVFITQPLCTAHVTLTFQNAQLGVLIIYVYAHNNGMGR